MILYEDLIEEIIEKGSKYFDDIEVYIESNENLSVNIFNQEVSKYNIEEGGGLSVKAILGNKVGYSYTEKIDKHSIDEVISNLKNNLKYMSDDTEIIYGGSKEYLEHGIIKPVIRDVSIDYKISKLLELEKHTLNKDNRLRTNTLSYVEIRKKTYLYNSKGLKLYNFDEKAMIYFSIIAEDNKDIKTGSSFTIFKDFKEVDFEELSQKAINESLSMLGADPIKSGKYIVAFKNTTFANLLGSFAPIFYGETVQKGMSLLKNKKGVKIANSNVNIIDNPFLKGGFGNRSFDDEGTATSKKYLIKQGVLKNYLYNWKTALKDGEKSTGNASRNYKGSVGISYTNLYLEPDINEVREILNNKEDIVYLTNLQGLHSGLDPISGDFSLSASGYLVRENKKVQSINQITVSGNFFELLNNIEKIGNDLKFTLNSGGRIGSPTIITNDLSISGK